MIARILYFVFLLVLMSNTSLFAQDTLRISYSDFVEQALNNSGQLDYEQQNVKLAKNRVDMAKSQRILPSMKFSSQHGLVPAVKSDSTLPWGEPLPRDEYYLDPNLRNDWEDWGVFNRFEVSAAQPLFTWGAINTAIEAARLGAESARYSFQAKKADLETKLFELYFSYVLAMEVERLLDEAQNKIDDITKELDKALEEGDQDIDGADIYKFEIFKSEFDIQKQEVAGNMEFIRETWNYVLRNDEGIIYEPETRFLDPLATKIEPVDFYHQSALNNRPELKALRKGAEATRTYISSLKKKNLPGLFLGGYIKYANTPNRPRQDNPFIQNTTNLFTGGFGLSIRMNLNFFSIRASLERSRIELRKVSYAQEAAQDGILLDLYDKYRKAVLADTKVEKTDEALVTSKKWLREEQLDFDIGMGDVKDYVDALKKELELKLKLKQNTFELNKSLARLNKAAGLPLNTLITN
ncbi:MAG: TolC family protein [Balneolaceae bacterium]|nr:TolC family protein [Balneolaceae bacterium]